MKKSADATPSTKCFSGIIRRMLCTRSLQTHPSDQFIEASKKEINDQTAENKSSKYEENYAKQSTPGVVAKLMGLDSFPNTPKDRADLGSYFRSRSVNSIDFLSHFDSTKKGHNRRHHHHHQQHRRVRTSVSFREDDEYRVVLNLEKVDENEEYRENLLFMKKSPKVDYQQRDRSEKSEKNLQEKKVAGKKPGKKTEVEFGNVESQRKDFRGKMRVRSNEKRPIIKPLNSDEALLGSKCMQRKKKKVLSHDGKVHSECSLKKLHPKASVSEVAPRASSRNKRTSQISTSESRYTSGSHSDNGEARAITKEKSESRKTKNKEKCCYKSIVEEICSLAEEDLKENWVSNFEKPEEICQQFGQEVLEVLLREFVDELVLLCGAMN